MFISGALEIKKQKLYKDITTIGISVHDPGPTYMTPFFHTFAHSSSGWSRLDPGVQEVPGLRVCMALIVVYYLAYYSSTSFVRHHECSEGAYIAQ